MLRNASTQADAHPEATYVWVGDDSISYLDFDPPKEFAPGDELPREYVADLWDDRSSDIAVLDENDDLVDVAGAGARNPERAKDVLDADTTTD